MTEMARNYANFSGDNYPDFVKQIARETMRAWAENSARPVEQRASCRVPGCQCNGRVDYMDWGSEDMTDTDDSEYEETETDIEESSCSTVVTNLGRGQRRLYSDTTGVGRSGSHKEQQTHSGDGIS